MQLVRKTREYRAHLLGCRLQALPPQTSNASAQEETALDSSFDVATAIALAGCAFESYNEPIGVVEGYQEWSINGTYTTYVDRFAVCASFQMRMQACCRRMHCKADPHVPDDASSRSAGSS